MSGFLPGLRETGRPSSTIVTPDPFRSPPFRRYKAGGVCGPVDAGTPAFARAGQSGMTVPCEVDRARAKFAPRDFLAGFAPRVDIR